MNWAELVHKVAMLGFSVGSAIGYIKARISELARDIQEDRDRMDRIERRIDEKHK